MDRFRQKQKKEKPLKHVDKDNTQSFITDVKFIKENLKIKEILRTVKMNSSMRVKAPRGSKVMNNKDFNDNDDLFNDDLTTQLEENLAEPPSATNPNVKLDPESNLDNDEVTLEDTKEDESVPETELQDKSRESLPITVTEPECVTDNLTNNISDELSTSKSTDDINVLATADTKIRNFSNITNAEVLFNTYNVNLKNKERKLSLDHTMLTRRDGLSQSELDLNSIGKSPLERKSSFFRKKMDSFLKNTTEIFKRQSSQLGKPQPIQRRGSMSVSLQSLNDKTIDLEAMTKPSQGSTTSLQSVSTVGRSTSSLSASRAALGASDGDSLAGSQPALSASQPIGDISDSAHSLNEAYIQESLLSSRAISMSSGLDSATATRRRKSSNRSNRVTWVASEGLTNYFRRIIQNEKGKESQLCQSYSDFTTIPENDLHEASARPGVAPTPAASKGRRLSYQRAVSGEDPLPPPRYSDSTLRRRLLDNSEEASIELSNLLADFSRNGVPPLKGFAIANIPDEAFAYLFWAERPQNLEDFYDVKRCQEIKDEFPPSVIQKHWDCIEKILCWEHKVFWSSKLSSAEEARQTVVRELVNTEAVHIRHLFYVVEVFMAAAHALQDAGKMLDVDTERLFSNVPDVLNASLIFWEIAIYPMLADAVENCTVFNTELMSAGFCRFREILSPYEKFVSEQTKALDYLRSLTNNVNFMLYLSWCHSQKECNRLQLSDILVKPMQRLTKYSLILHRVTAHTDTEPERTTLIAMENFAKNYVLDLNRSIRQREELEKLDALANSIESYEIDFKDDDMDRYFKMFSQLNLKAPMVNCLPSHSRTIIYQGDLRYKDHLKEMEVRAFLLTDMLLICKKQSKGSSYPYKMIRPKYMVDKMLHFPKAHSRNAKEVIALTFVVVDEVGSSCQGFTLTETTKDPSAQGSLRLWEQKLKEARLTYDLGVWFAKNPSRDLSEVEMDSSSEYALTTSGNKPGVKQSSDDLNIEREARERVAAMLHRSMGASTECDFSQASFTTDSFDAAGEASGASGGRGPGMHSLRHPMHRTSTGGSSRNSRLSSFQHSTSAASHDEPQAGPSRNIYRAGSSVEHLIPPLNPDDTVTSITVNVVSESESETVVPTQQQSPKPAGRSSGNTLRVQPAAGVLALVHSLPDLTVDVSPPRPAHRPLLRYTVGTWAVVHHSQIGMRVRRIPQSGVLALVLSLPNLTVDFSLLRSAQSTSPQSASEKLYQSHQELLQRNRLSATQQHQYLSPDHRGISYPPPSPTRASLKRGLAFSYSFKNPPLSKMGHVNSQSQLQAEAGPSSSQQAKPADKAVASSSTAMPSTSTDKAEKKSKQFISRHKSGSSSRSAPAPPAAPATPAAPTPPPRKDDKGD